MCTVEVTAAGRPGVLGLVEAMLKVGTSPRAWAGNALANKREHFSKELVFAK